MSQQREAIDTYLLRVLHTLLMERSVTRAAVKLNQSQPAISAALSVGFAVLTTWLGLAIAYFTDYPIGFTVTTVAFAGYLGVRGVRRLSSHRPRFRVNA